MPEYVLLFYELLLYRLQLYGFFTDNNFVLLTGYQISDKIITFHKVSGFEIITYCN